MTTEEQQRRQDEELPITRPHKRRTARMHQSLLDVISGVYTRSLRNRIESREAREQGFDEEWGHEFDITVEDPTSMRLDEYEVVITVRARDVTEALIFAAIDRACAVNTPATEAPEDDYEREA